MQHLEQYFGVPLFTWGKNRIELNETGKLAVAAARKLLQESELAEASWHLRSELPQDHSYISLTGELIEQFRLGKL